jgi:hypothetical protein
MNRQLNLTRSNLAFIDIASDSTAPSIRLLSALETTASLVDAAQTDIEFILQNPTASVVFGALR